MEILPAVRADHVLDWNSERRHGRAVAEGQWQAIDQQLVRRGLCQELLAYQQKPRAVRFEGHAFEFALLPQSRIVDRVGNLLGIASFLELENLPLALEQKDVGTSDGNGFEVAPDTALQGESFQ